MTDREMMKKRLIAAAEKAGKALDEKTINRLVEESPLINYTCDCGHGGKGYAIIMGDWIFCDQCKRKSRVVSVK